jgi:hypothetical protein
MSTDPSPRFARRPRQRIRLTARDLQAVVAVFEARYLTNRQIGRLLFGREDSSHARQRLRYLFDLDYVRKREAGPNEPDIYYLGLKGRRYVAAQGLCDRETADRVAGVAGDDVATPALMMSHELTLSGLYVSARLQCQRLGWGLHWRNARWLELERLGMQPDGWLAVYTGADPETPPRQAYLEFTAAMPTGPELRGKLARYRAYWERTRVPAAVLWFTTSRRKADALLEAIHQDPYRDCYLVGLIEDSAAFLTAPIWRWGDREPGHTREVVSWIHASSAALG